MCGQFGRLLAVVLFRMTGKRWLAAWVAAMFAWHPLHVESVAWVTERKDTLSALFAILCLLAYESYARRPTPRKYLLVLVPLALGLMSKSMLVTLPMVLLLLDFWPLRRMKDARAAVRLVAEKIPMLALAVAASIVTAIIRAAADVPLSRCPGRARIANVVVSYAVAI